MIMERRRDRRIRNGRFFYLGPSFNNDNLSNGIWVRSKVPIIIDITLIVAILFAISIIGLFTFIVTVAIPNLPDIGMPPWYTENDILFFWAGTDLSIFIFIFLSSWYIYYELIFKKRISPLFETNIKSPKMRLVYLDELVRSVLIENGFNFKRRGPVSLLGRRIIYHIPENDIYIDIANQSYKDVKVFSIGLGPVTDESREIALDLMRDLSNRARREFIKIVGKILPSFMTGEEDETFMVNPRHFSPYSHGMMPPRSDHRYMDYDKKEYGKGMKGPLINILLVIAILMFASTGIFGAYALLFIIEFDILIFLPVVVSPFMFLWLVGKLVKIIREEGFFGEKIDKE